MEETPTEFIVLIYPIVSSPPNILVLSRLPKNESWLKCAVLFSHNPGVQYFF